MSALVTNFIKSFWTWAVSLAGIAALYVGAVAIHRTLIFWIVLGSAVVLAGVRPAIRRFVDIAIKVRGYPSLLEQLGVAKAQAENSAEWVKEAASLADSAWQRGVYEGRGQILGALRA